jgi:GWxTD domain-containing protein
MTQISSFESEFVLDEFATFKRATTKTVYPYFHEFDISNLPTGNFILTVEVRDKENILRAVNSLFFQRDNPDVEIDMDKMGMFDIEHTFAGKITDSDTLTEYIKSCAPKATEQEKKFIYKGVETADLEKKQQFLYYFWYRRDRNNPKDAWLNYLEMVELVNDRYSTQVSKGYETDRGRIYLQYGPPSVISENYNEPSTYPYEIWHYYKLGHNQSDKRFVFYTNNYLANNFELLHSTAIGELKNPRWEVILNSRWYDPYGVDNNAVPEIWGGRARDFYNQPR